MNIKTLMYVLKRILLALLTVWVVITVTFFVMRAVPGGPFTGEKAITEAAKQALEAKYGLDKPVGEQYVTYLKDIVTRFDFGPSLKLRGRQVIDVIVDGMRTSVKLGLAAAGIALVITALICGIAGFFIGQMECEGFIGTIVGVLCGIVLSIFIGPMSGLIFSYSPETETTYRYEVTIDDSVSMNEFYDKYTVVEQRGDIVVIEEK